MKITKWNFTLEHETYRDCFGILQDRLELVETLPNWDYINRFLVPMVKLKNYTPETDVLDNTQGYNKSDLKNMLEDTLQELNK